MSESTSACSSLRTLRLMSRPKQFTITIFPASCNARKSGAPVPASRRSRHEMPCLMAEVEAAEAEGVQVDLLVAPLRLEVVERESLPDGRGSDAASGAATVRERSNLVLTCQRMTLGEPDASGRRRPVPVEGSDPK